MKSECEIRICDKCGKKSTFEKKSIGSSYFPNWIHVIQMSGGGIGVSTSDRPLTGGKDFCCLVCAVEFLTHLLRCQEDDEKIEEDREAENLLKVMR